MTVAIIGAGPSGLALAKQLKDRNISFVVFERDSDLGGVWNISNEHSMMYESAHTISSKSFTGFSEFPMPEEYTEYISHTKMLAYLKSYADKFDLRKYIKFNTAVKSIKQSDKDGFELETENGDKHIYQYISVASGRVNKANYPDIDTSHFSGQILHTADYKEPSVFKHKNVLVIGAGNSGCDIACEAISTANHVSLSLRRGYHFIPKFILGMPADVFGETSVKLRLPMLLRQIINQLILRFFQGNIQNIGFPKPDHRIFESHPIVNELLVYYVRHGDIQIQKDIKEISASGVIFCDGSHIDVDIILFATGFNPDYSFFGDNIDYNIENTHLNLFSKKHAGLSFLGLVDPNGGIFGILESQAIAVAQSVALNYSSGKLLSLMQQRVKLNGGIHYVNSKRHRYEVDHATYRRALNKQIQVFSSLSRSTKL